jgi:hypothetical protein
MNLRTLEMRTLSGFWGDKWHSINLMNYKTSNPTKINVVLGDAKKELPAPTKVTVDVKVTKPEVPEEEKPEMEGGDVDAHQDALPKQEDEPEQPEQEESEPEEEQEQPERHVWPHYVPEPEHYQQGPQLAPKEWSQFQYGGLPGRSPLPEYQPPQYVPQYVPPPQPQYNPAPQVEHPVSPSVNRMYQRQADLIQRTQQREIETIQRNEQNDNFRASKRAGRSAIRNTGRAIKAEIRKFNNDENTLSMDDTQVQSQRAGSDRAMRHFMRNLARKQRRLTRNIDNRRTERRRFSSQRRLDRRVAGRLERVVERENRNKYY